MNYEAEGTRDIRIDMSSFCPVFWTIVVVNCSSVLWSNASISSGLVASPEILVYEFLPNSGRNKWKILQYYNVEIINAKRSNTPLSLQNL